MAEVPKNRSKRRLQTEEAIEVAWRALARELNSKFHAPPGVTVADIGKAARVLRLVPEVPRG